MKVLGIDYTFFDEYILELSRISGSSAMSCLFSFSPINFPLKMVYLNK